MGLIDYRSLYESSTSLLIFNVIKEIATLVSFTGVVNLKRKNKIEWNGKKVVGVMLQENGMFILTDDDKVFEISEDDKDFELFASVPLNVVTLLENIRKELKINE